MSTKKRDERLLVVDDHELNRDIATRLLTRAGFQVSAVIGGHEAIEALSAGSFDLVLMDIHMPGMSGIEATSAIRALPGELSRIPVIALTADTISDLGDDFEGAGFSAFATKPIERGVLLETVELLLSKGSVSLPEPDAMPDIAANLDLDTVESLKQAIGESAFPALLDKFILEIRRSLVRLAPPLDAQRLEDVQFSAHNIKGCAGTIGAGRLQLAAQTLEHAIRDGDLSTATSQLSEFEGLADDALEALSAYREALK